MNARALDHPLSCSMAAWETGDNYSADKPSPAQRITESVIAAVALAVITGLWKRSYSRGLTV